MQAAVDLRSLKARPYDLLVEIERRTRASLAAKDAEGGVSQEWVGIAFRIGDQRFLASRDDVREVLMPPPITRVPGARGWLAGIANVRGQLLPVIDLGAFLDTGAVPMGRATRVLVVNHKVVPAGLLVDEVFGFRRFLEGERRSTTDEGSARFDPFVEAGFERGDEAWDVFALRRLVENDRFLAAAEA